MLNQIQKQVVVKMWESYQLDNDSIGKMGQKYVINFDKINIPLPAELSEYAERGAGTHDKGTKPVGIRRTVNDAYSTINDIMSSPESLEAFILTSDKSGMDYVELIRTKKIKTEISSTKVEFWKRYNKADLDSLISKFGRQQVQIGIDSLTIDQFETKFNLI